MDIFPRQEHVFSISAHCPSREICAFCLLMDFPHPLSSVPLSCSEMVTSNQEIKEHSMQSSGRKCYPCGKLEDDNENAAWNYVHVVISLYAFRM